MTEYHKSIITVVQFVVLSLVSVTWHLITMYLYILLKKIEI